MNVRSMATLLCLCIYSVAPVHAQNPSVAEQYLFQQANAERAQRSIPPLHWDAALYRAAVAHAREMAAQATISHQFQGEPDVSQRANTAGAHFSVIAENVAEAQTAPLIHDAWMNSPGHRANLLDPKLDAVGISVVQKDGQLYAVQDFGRAVETLTLDAQEQSVAKLIMAAGPVKIQPSSDDARKTCALDNGFAGARQPAFVMHYTSTDLTNLPDTLKAKVASGQYHEGAVGACAATTGQSFTTYRIAILLYQ